MTDTNPTRNPEPTPTPAPAPAPAPEPTPAPEPAPASEELKPLTDAEMESMSTEEITAHAEKFEAQVKAAKQQTPEQIKQNQIIRAKKAQEKATSSTTEPAPAPAETAEKQIAQADLLTLGKTDFEIGSEEQTLLQERVDKGIIKTYAEGLTHVGVSAELAAIAEKNSAKTVIDENDDPETKLKTKKEAIAHARATGEVPEDPALREALVEDNLSKMSSLN